MVLNRASWFLRQRARSGTNLLTWEPASMELAFQFDPCTGILGIADLSSEHGMIVQ